jgi:glycosyltransferase involved in cell wall biosynthesis
VVDNYSSDATRKIAVAFEAKVLLCRGERSRQVNAGVKIARGEFVYRVDGDFVLQEGVVTECVVGCKSKHVDGALIHNSSDPSVSLWAQVRNMEREMYKDDDLNVAVRFLTRASYDAIGGFDEGLVAGEDYDLHNRFLGRGFRYVRVNSVEVHKGEPKTISETVLKHYYYGKSLGRFVKKNKYRAFRQLSPFRPAFIRHRNLFAGHLRLTLAFNFYTTVRYFSAFAGLVIGKTEAPPATAPLPALSAIEVSSRFSRTSARPVITTIIPTKDSGKTIGKCIESIQNSGQHDNVRIIVVDNNSTDQTCSIARAMGATVVKGGPERSAQRNIGALNSSTEYLLFVDSDMEFTPSVLDECARAVDAGVDAAVISEVTVGSGYWANVRKLERASYFGDSLYEAARLFRKSSFFKLGGYDAMLTGLEDYDIQARIEKAHLSLVHLRSPILHHEETFNVKDHLMKKYYYASRSRIYISKYPRRSIAQFFPLRRTYLKRDSPVVHNPSTFVGIMFLKVAEIVVASIGVTLGRGRQN